MEQKKENEVSQANLVGVRRNQGSDQDQDVLEAKQREKEGQDITDNSVMSTREDTGEHSSRFSLMNLFSSSTPARSAPLQRAPTISSRGKSFMSSFMSGGFKRTSSVSAASMKKGKKRMLTYEQLSDLFRRLDRDGNGELDLEEFLQISTKLKLQASEEYIARVFRDVATNKSGTLNMQAFVSAYQIIFTRSSDVSSTSFSQNEALRRRQKAPSEAVTAVRYGSDSCGDLLFEVFLGTAIELREGPAVVFYERRVYDLSVDTGDVSDQEYSIDPNFNATLAEVNERIVRDSMQNKLARSKIYWWLDIAMMKVASFRVDKYIAALGLPNDSKFRTNFNQFGTCLPRDEKNHVYVGNGTCRLGSVSSLSLFVQSIALQRIPLAFHIPLWLECILATILPERLRNAVKRYYSTRLAFFFGGSSQISPATEYKNLYESACNIAKRLDDETDIDEAEILFINELEEEEARLLENHTFKHAPLPHRPRQRAYDTSPRWLMSGTEIKRNPADVLFDSVGVHIMNYGHDNAGCCLTIREIDSESKHRKVSAADALQKVAADQTAARKMIHGFAKKGVIGRIITGIRIKMLQNSCNDGVAMVAGNLNDGPASLASVLITLVQSFSMNTLGTMSMWLDTISNEVDELAVSKHTSQANELWRVLNVIMDYAVPTESIISNMFQQAVQQRSEETAQQEEEELEEALKEAQGSSTNRPGKSFTSSPGPRKRLNSHDSELSGASSTSESDNESDKFIDKPIANSPLGRSSFMSSRGSIARRAMGTLIMKRRTTHMQGGEAENSIQLSFAVLPHGSNNLPMSADLLQPFFGDNINTICQNLEMILEGDESLEVHGTRYWMEQLNSMVHNVKRVKEDIRSSLEEKRNFFSFILTVVTVFLAPLTILTGYWGMNFDNMIELDSTTYNDLPGVKLLWFVATCIYLAFLCLSIHFRVLYSAT